MPHIPGNAPVSLTEVLAARDARVSRQQVLLRHCPGALISYTVNMPGPVKDSPAANTIFTAGLEELDKLMLTEGWAVLARQTIYPATGPEALITVNALAFAVKQGMVHIEDTHFLGRFFDLDVLSPTEGHISRTQLGAPLRRCLLCDSLPAVCVRSRRHTLEELLAALHARVLAWKAGMR